MDEFEPTLLRLRAGTKAMLREAVKRSAHRSMATLADEILEAELRKRGFNSERNLDRMLDAARKVK